MLTKEQALSIYSQMASQYKGTPQEHQTIQEGYKVLTNLIEKQKDQVPLSTPTNPNEH